MSQKSKRKFLHGSETLKQKLLTRQMNIVMIIAMVFFPMTALRALEIGFKPVNAFQALMCITFVGVFLGRRRLKPEVAAGVVSAAILLWCMGASLNYGVLAPAQVAVPFVVVFSSIAFGHRIALRFFWSAAAGTLIVAALHLAGVVHCQVDVNWYVQSWTSWIILIVLQTALALWYLFLIAPISEAERKTTEHLEAILQGINDALFIHDKETGAILQVNQKTCEMYGYSREDLLKLRVGELSAGSAPYAHEDARAWLERAVRQGPQLFEWQAKGSEGRLFWVEVNMRCAILDGAERLLVLVRDISARKQAELALRQVQANMSALIESTNDLIWSVDLENRYLAFNRNEREHIRQVYGTEVRVGVQPAQLMPPERAAYWASLFARTLAEGPFRQELASSNGRVHDVALSPIIDGCQKVGVSVFARDITERKQAEEALRESERKTRAIFDLSFGFVGLLTPDGTLVEANKTALDFAGITMSDVVGKPFWDTPWWSHSSEARETIRTAVLRAAEGDLVHAETTHRTKSGSLRIIEFTVKPIKDEAGSVTQLIPEGRDITEQRKALDELRASEEKFSRLFQSSPDAVLVTRVRDDTIVEVNNAFESFLGYTRAELIDRNVLDLKMYSAPDRTRLISMLRERGSIRDTEFDVTRSSGDSAQVLASTELIEIKGEAHAITILHDITERKLAALALSKSEERYRAIVEQAADGIFIMDLHGTLLQVNSSFAQAHGYTVVELLELGLDGITVEGTASVTKLIPQLLAGESLTVVTEHRRKDGSPLPLEVTTSLVEYGGTQAIIAFHRDLTERRRAAEESAKLEAQLRQAQKMESVGLLAGGVAHDFNNLLSVILYHTEFAAEGVPPESPVITDLLEVTKATDRAVALTRQLLAFSRKQVLKPVSTNLNAVAVDVEKMLRRVLGEDIAIVRTLAPDLGTVIADPDQIGQVLLNLAVNARDAMPDGGKLTIETSNVELDDDYVAHHLSLGPGHYVQLAVTDTGCGMDEATRSRIFEPFFTTKEKGRGTGLGLSTVYGIVKQSGGAIWVYSEPGLGTSFKIFLPQELSISEESTTAPPKVSTLTQGTETILVVEDEDTLRSAANRILGAAGYAVLLAANGAEALQTSAKFAGPIHLLLTDVVMPGMNGRVLAEQLLLTRPDVKVVYMSGYTDNAIVHHGVLDAGTHFLNKPVGAAELTRKIREVLDG